RFVPAAVPQRCREVVIAAETLRELLDLVHRHAEGLLGRKPVAGHAVAAGLAAELLQRRDGVRGACAGRGVLHAGTRRRSARVSESCPPSHAHGSATPTRSRGYQRGPNAGPLFQVAAAPAALTTMPTTPSASAWAIGRSGARRAARQQPAIEMTTR